MLVIRMQRTGRSGHAHFRVVAQDRRFHPSSGRVVAYLGDYNPHTKAATISKEKIEEYLAKGAQPSDSIVKLLQKEGIKLPKRIKTPSPKQKTTRFPEKLRKNRPADAKAESSQPAAEESAEDEAGAEAEQIETAPEEPATTAEASAEEADTEPEKPAEAPAEESATEAEPKAPESGNQKTEA